MLNFETYLIFDIAKWAFLAGTVFVAFWQYRREFRTLNQIRRLITRPDVIPQLAEEARSRMLVFLLLFVVFTAWIMSYEFKIRTTEENINAIENELQETNKKYNSIIEINREIYSKKVSNDQKKIYADDIKKTYVDAFVAFYLMRKCDLSEESDPFIINSSLSRELWLNNIPLSIREDIIFEAKVRFKEKYANYDCSFENKRENDIAQKYVKYIESSRTSLLATF